MRMIRPPASCYAPLIEALAEARRKVTRQSRGRVRAKLAKSAVPCNRALPLGDFANPAFGDGAGGGVATARGQCEGSGTEP